MTEITARFLSGESHKFRHVIEKVKNPNLAHESAWASIRPLLRVLARIEPLLGDDVLHPVSRELFNAARSRFLAKDPERALEEYKKAKRVALSPLPDEDFERFDRISTLYEKELFNPQRSKSGKA